MVDPDAAVEHRHGHVIAGGGAPDVANSYAGTPAERPLAAEQRIEQRSARPKDAIALDPAHSGCTAQPAQGPAVPTYEADAGRHPLAEDARSRRHGAARSDEPRAPGAVGGMRRGAQH